MDEYKVTSKCEEDTISIAENFEAEKFPRSEEHSLTPVTG